MKLTEEQKTIIRREEYEFPKLFTHFRETEYGILFYNEQNKESHDSNHAVIYPDRIDNLSSVLKEIADFYNKKSIVPAIFHPCVKGYFLKNEKTFAEQGFKITYGKSHRISVLSEKSQIIPNGSLDIQKLTEWDRRIADDILKPNDEDYEIPVGEATMKHKGSHLFVGYRGEKAVVYVLFHVSALGCTRFDYIDTAKNERGKGYARQISHRVMEFCLKENLPLPATWFANFTSERLNFEAGFRPSDLWIESGYAEFEGM